MILRNDLALNYKANKKAIDAAIIRVLSSGSYTLGKEVSSFESEFAKFIGVSYAVGVANGTDALELVLKGYGISKGDEVITCAYTAIATVCAIVSVGAKPVFVDIDPETFLMDNTKVEKALTSSTKAIIPVHIFGNVFDILSLKKIVVSKVKIIEDAAQAHGSMIGSKLAGSLGDASAFSFYPTKNLGGFGDGGMVVTNDRELFDKVKLMRNYGLVDKDHSIFAGVNSRLDEIQAAVLRVRLKDLNKLNKKRNVIANLYREELRKDLFKHQKINSNVFSNYHVFVSRFLRDREKLINYLTKEGIQVNTYYSPPIHLQKAFRYLGYKKGDLPNTEEVALKSVVLPIHPYLKNSVLRLIITKVNNFKG